jgi:spore maturation protein A
LVWEGIVLQLAFIWVIGVAAAVGYGIFADTADAVAAALFDGVNAAVEFCLGAGVIMCLWCGVFEVMRRAGLADGLSRLLRPILCKLFPETSRHRETFDALSSNVAANLLGLGNAATPMGIRAAQGMAQAHGRRSARELATLVVLNTASVQLIPSTIASVRAACGAAVPFDILPAVWVTSVCSVAAGLLSVRVLRP